MTTKRTIFLLAASFSLLVASQGCKYADPELFTAPEDFVDGEEVTAETLNYGQEQYILYCYACHGAQGDGRGPASRWLRPPPRDFRLATFKFAKVIDGLPRDEDLKHIIRHGLDGTPMLKWDIPDNTLNAIIQYIKTFSPEGEGFRDEDAEYGEVIEVGDDPWSDDQAGAVTHGKKLYHSKGCWSCHAAYADKASITAANAEIKGKDAKVAFRPNMYYSEPKVSSIYTAPIKDFYTNHFRRNVEYDDCEDDDGCEDSQKCVYGRCEHKLRILPPDFTFDVVRSGSEPADIFKTISAGIPGAGMPQFKGVETDKDIWALAHYVNSLIKLKDTPGAADLKEALRKAAAKN